MQRLTSYDLSVIARGHVAGRSDAVIGARLDPPRDRSTVRKARARPVVQTMIRDERRRQSSAARSAAYRQRKKEKEEQAEKLERGYAAYPPDSLARGNQNRYPHISETGYLITSNVWYPPPRRATRADYLRYPQPPPGQLEADPGFGPGHVYPELARHALGHVPEDQKLVRLVIPPGISHEYNRGSTTCVCSVRAFEVDELLAAGATRA